jgi:hypothetical protein
MVLVSFNPMSHMTRLARCLAAAVVAAAVLPFASAHAQKSGAAAGSGVFTTGTSIVSVGLLTDPTGIGGSYEYGLRQLAPGWTLGVGGTLGFQSRSSFGVDATTIWALGNANVHYAIPNVPELDVYGGLSLGIVRTSVDSPSPGLSGVSDSDVALGINLGGRYMFTPKLGAFLQLGVADAPEIFLGVSFKF